MDNASHNVQIAHTPIHNLITLSIIVIHVQINALGVTDFIQTVRSVSINSY